MAKAYGGRRVVVVGGGIAGLTAAYRLGTVAPDVEVTLVEAGDRLGGKVRTERVDGFVVDGGPDSLLTMKPAALALMAELGIGDRVEPARAETRGTFVLRGGRLCPLPDGMNGFVPRKVGPVARSRLFSPLGKLRLAWEYVVPARPDDGMDESLRSFTERRLGAEAYRRLVEPMAAGIFAADPGTLSLMATMPHLRAAELGHGGLTRAMLAERRAARKGQAASPAPGGGVVAPVGGMGDLVDALTARLGGVDVRLGTTVLGLEGAAERYRLHLRGPEGEGALLADDVVLAVPAVVAAGIVSRLDPDLADLLRATPYTSTTTVALGYRTSDLPDGLPGHGYLVPTAEGRSARACTWMSAKFDHRAPAGHALLRVSLARAGGVPAERADDQQLVTAAREELADTLGISAEPVLTRVFRWHGVMPQYSVGHLERVATLERLLAAHPGLLVAGSGYHGLSVSDCVASGSRSAEAVADRLAA